MGSKVILDSNWPVAAGEESEEAVFQRHDETDPRLSASLYMASDNDDSCIPAMPRSPIEIEEGEIIEDDDSDSSIPAIPRSPLEIEEGEIIEDDDSEASMITPSTRLENQNKVITSGSPVTPIVILPISVMQVDAGVAQHCNFPGVTDEMISIAMVGIAAALMLYSSIDTAELMELICSTVRELLRREGLLSSTGIEPLSTRRETTGLIPLLGSSTSHSQSNTFDHSLRVRTGIRISEPGAVTSFASSKSFRSGESPVDTDLLMVPMSPFRNSRTTNLESDVVKTKRLVNEYGAADVARWELRHEARFISPAVSFPLPQTAFSEFPRAGMQPTISVVRSPQPMRPLPQVHCPPVMRKGPLIPLSRTMITAADPYARNELHIQPTQNITPKPCIYFRSSVGCLLGTSCPHLHLESDAPAASRAEPLPSAKRRKLEWEMSKMM